MFWAPDNAKIEVTQDGLSPRKRVWIDIPLMPEDENMLRGINVLQVNVEVEALERAIALWKVEQSKKADRV